MNTIAVSVIEYTIALGPGRNHNATHQYASAGPGNKAETTADTTPEVLHAILTVDTCRPIAKARAIKPNQEIRHWRRGIEDDRS